MVTTKNRPATPRRVSRIIRFVAGLIGFIGLGKALLFSVGYLFNGVGGAYGIEHLAVFALNVLIIAFCIFVAVAGRMPYSSKFDN